MSEPKNKVDEPKGPSETAVVPPEELERGSSLWRDAWRRLLKNKAAVVGLVIVVVMMVCCMAASLFAAHVTHFAFDEQHLEGGAKPPGARSVPAVYTTFFESGEFGFSDADLDGDGGVAPRELSDLLATMEFDRFDADGDGELDAEEVDDAPIAKVTIPGDEPELLVTMRAAFTTYLERSYDLFDGNRDHLLVASEFAAMKARRDDETLGRRFAEFVDHIDTKVELPLERNQVRNLSRELAKKWCESESACTVDLAQSRHFTDIFPLAQAERFVRKHDGDGDGLLAASEFPGVPEPHTHFLGTDDQGRDLLTRILYGGRISFAVGILATLVSLIIGVSWGAVAGYVGGRVDNIMMRFVDVLYGLPFMFLVILLMVIVGQQIYLLFIALGAVQWLTMSRIVRGQVISLKGREFVEAARSIGVSSPAIVFKHLIPNALGPIIVYSTLLIPAVMLEEAFLSFLGLGVRAPDASWGTLASDGANAIQTHPWLILYPGLALAVTLLSLNFLGDGLRDALDPHMKKD